MSITPITAARSYRAVERPVTRAQLETEINYGRSKVFEFIAEGMPVWERTTAGNLFMVSDCRAWLRRRGYWGGNVVAGYATPANGGSHE